MSNHLKLALAAIAIAAVCTTTPYRHATAASYALPSISSCGTGAAVSGVNGLAYTITLGTGSTSCVLTSPASTYVNQPVCVLSTRSVLTGGVAYSLTGTTAPVLTLTITSLIATAQIDVICHGPPNNP